MGKNDIEKVEQVILGIVQSKLAAKVAEINTDKGGDALLVDIETKNYLSDLYQEELTPSLFILYGIKEPELQSPGCDSAETWVIFYYIFIQDKNNLGTLRSKIFRYTRALKEIINENCRKIARHCSNPQISTLTPQDLEPINNDTPFKMGGIEFKITLS